ncbi:MULTISPECIES: hypothetical protein [Burkholderia]|uniref:hypothetical protein n=1 Tax=Burkholderia TaxID=32008 RepID=UPI001269992B|nr:MULTISPECIES: hypothetical protein [Burkholderia]
MTTRERYVMRLRVCAEELLSLINGPKFLRGGVVPRKGEVLVTNEKDAEIFACDQDVDVIKGGEYQYWTGILENNSRTIEQMDLQDSLDLGDEFSLNISEIFDGELMSALISKGEEFGVSSSIVDVICGNFYIFLVNKTFFDEQLPLADRMYEIYQGGGIPCGWKGEFPDGEILIYSKD